MPHVDIAATRRAAAQVGTAADDTRSLLPEAQVASTAAGELSGSVSLHVLHPLQGVLTSRLNQLGEELDALRRGMDDLAHHTEQATG